ncbi:MAG: hypothetical protein Q4A66_10750 [Eubacteriales bacterium]|nr:hypothetical protein [Eubacteriales bacterium]
MVLICALALCLSACGGTGSDAAGATSLSFSDAVTFETIEALDGQPVSIVGYMATMSPISGKYMYLMNMPYQSCPFCLPNTTQLANTMAVYAPEGKTFDYTDQAIRVVGTMVVDDTIDEFGYAYNYRIADATYEVVDLATISEDYALWQAIATDGIVNELSAMFDYLHFLCQWTEYQGNYIDESGATVAFNLYPGDVKAYLEDDSAYGYADKYADSYFPGLVSRIRAISPDGLEDLVAIVEAAQQQADAAVAALDNSEYTYDEATDKFTLNNGDAMYEQFYDLYYQFSLWLTRWEL